METLAIDPRILRVLVGPDIKVVPGRAMMARVVATAPGGRGTLSIAGYLLDAELPEEIAAGQDLRLIVRDVSPERVLLALSPEHPEQAAAPGPGAAPHPQALAAATPSLPPAIAIPLPGGGTLEVTEREGRGGGGRASGSEMIAVRYNAPALGALDVRLQLDSAALRASLTVEPGTPLELARASSAELRDALAAALNRPASVTVAPRHEPLDVYA